MKVISYIILSLVLFGCSKNQDNTKPDASSQSVQYKSNVSLLVNVKKTSEKQAPNFTWYDESGKQVSFSEISKGKPVLINFWATWCGPCIAETPDLVKIYNEYKSKGALVVGISTDRDEDALNLVSNFIKEKKVTYPIIIDNGDLEEAFGGLRGYPTSFYIDKDGNIVKKFIGIQTKEKFASEFEALM